MDSTVDNIWLYLLVHSVKRKQPIHECKLQSTSLLIFFVFETKLRVAQITQIRGSIFHVELHCMILWNAMETGYSLLEKNPTQYFMAFGMVPKEISWLKLKETVNRKVCRGSHPPYLKHFLIPEEKWCRI